MIYTVTLNPSLDYVVGVEHFKTGNMNRTVEEVIFPGGKGINVSIVLKNLGMESITLGFVAGFSGKEIKDRLNNMGIEHDFCEVESGYSRINVKLRSLSKAEDDTYNVSEETEINGMGPIISPEELDSFYKKLNCLKSGDVIVMAGSIPGSLPGTIYRDIMLYLKSKQVKVVVDATKKLLKNVLDLNPFLIKPNHLELGEFFDVRIESKEEACFYAKKLQSMGATNVLVSMAGDGAVLVAEDGKVYQTEAPKGEVVNSVGAGDSMVAGFLYGYISSNSFIDAFNYGVCAGSASAFSSELATREAVERLILLQKEE